MLVLSKEQQKAYNKDPMTLQFSQGALVNEKGDTLLMGYYKRDYSA